MIVLAAPRRHGRTTGLITWLLGGHPVDGWPQWSRVLVVPDAVRIPRLLRDHADLQSELWDAGTGGLGKLAITVHELAQLLPYRRIDPAVEFALDDADEILRHALGVLPALISIEGAPTTVEMIANRAREGQS